MSEDSMCVHICTSLSTPLIFESFWLVKSVHVLYLVQCALLGLCQVIRNRGCLLEMKICFQSVPHGFYMFKENVATQTVFYSLYG